MDFEGKTILITGGTGSLGWGLVKRLLQTRCRKIIIYSRDEYKQFKMDQHFCRYRDRLRYFIGDVRDKDRLYRAFVGVDYVIHAAALKHVHLMEYNPIEAVNTNIMGAKNLLDAAIDRGVKKVIALSTDKAVNPVNLYGATKLVSDKLFRAAHAYSTVTGPVFVLVRYGNVVGSRGSVIPFFEELRDQGSDTLPITDMRMTRFWITMEKAVDLVLQAIELGHGGEVFIGKVPSCKVTDLARAIHPAAELIETGIRPGEKLHEVMLTEDEARAAYEYDDHYVVYPLRCLEEPRTGIRPGGVRVPDGFDYSSSSNKEWLTSDDLARLLKDLPPRDELIASAGPWQAEGAEA
ncbi:MAG: UDP-N-acetylglucosamine 4,6-dehydratase (inverting) [Candidatus Krumholzibacteriia bacterium]